MTRADEFVAAYLAYLEQQLRVWMDIWTWEDESVRAAIDGHRAIIDGIKDGADVWMSGHEGLKISWVNRNKDRTTGSQQMDDKCINKMIARWRAGEFNNEE